MPPFLPALVLAMVLRFVVEWCLALAAFWLTKVTAINSLFFALTTFFGGIVRAAGGAAGLDADGRGVDAVPVEPGLPGRGVPRPAYGSEIWLGYAAQLGWIALALGGLALLWRRATRRYSAVGA